MSRINEFYNELNNLSSIQTIEMIAEHPEYAKAYISNDVCYKKVFILKNDKDYAILAGLNINTYAECTFYIKSQPLNDSTIFGNNKKFYGCMFYADLSEDGEVVTLSVGNCCSFKECSFSGAPCMNFNDGGASTFYNCFFTRTSMSCGFGSCSVYIKCKFESCSANSYLKDLIQNDAVDPGKWYNGENNCPSWFDTMFAWHLDNDFKKICRLKETLIGYKIAVYYDDENGVYEGRRKENKHACVVKMEIPKDAFVISPAGVKCRTNMAKVIDIIGICKDSKLYGSHLEKAHSIWRGPFEYVVGEELDVTDEFDFDCSKVCSNGIHFYTTKEALILDQFLSESFPASCFSEESIPWFED